MFVWGMSMESSSTTVTPPTPTPTWLTWVRKTAVAAMVSVPVVGAYIVIGDLGWDSRFVVWCKFLSITLSLFFFAVAFFVALGSVLLPLSVSVKRIVRRATSWFFVIGASFLAMNIVATFIAPVEYVWCGNPEACKLEYDRRQLEQDI